LALLQQQHDFDGANLRNVLLSNGKLAEDIAELSKAFGKRNDGPPPPGPRSGRGRKRIYPEPELASSNDSNNNNICKSGDFEPRGKLMRLSPGKELKLANGLLSGQNSPDN